MTRALWEVCVGTSPGGSHLCARQTGLVPLAAELGLGQDVGGQGVQGGLQQKVVWVRGSKAHTQGVLLLSGGKGQSATHQVLHVPPAAVAQLLDDLGLTVVFPGETEPDLSAWPLGSVLSQPCPQWGLTSCRPSNSSPGPCLQHSRGQCGSQPQPAGQMAASGRELRSEPQKL